MIWIMDLRTLRYFIYVVEAQSFSRAAEHLRVAQPALSRQIRKLEDEFGTPLLVRSVRGIQLTDAGALLFRRAQSLLRQATQTFEDVKAQASSVGGEVTVGSSLATGQRIAPALLRHCAAQHPDIRINLVEGFSGYVYSRFLQNELSLCLIHNPPTHAGIVIEPLVEEPLYLLGLNRQPLDMKHWYKYPLVLPSKTHSLRLLLEAAAAKRGHELLVKYNVDGLGMTSTIVGSGLACTILARDIALELMKKNGLAGAAIPDASLHWVLSLAYRLDQSSARPVQVVCDAIRQIVSPKAPKPGRRHAARQ